MMNAVLISIVIGSVIGIFCSEGKKEKDEVEIMIDQMTDDLIRIKQQLEKDNSELQKRLEELEED